jgi:hypothetical protein
MNPEFMCGRNASPTFSLDAKLLVVNVNPAGSVENACESNSAESVAAGPVESIHASASDVNAIAAAPCAIRFMVGDPHYHFLFVDFLMTSGVTHSVSITPMR